MSSRSRFFLLFFVLLFIIPVRLVSAQTGDPVENRDATESENYQVFLPLLSKVVLETDVAVADIQMEPNPAAIGDTVHLSFTITNLGLTPTTEFPVNWQLVALGETEPLASGMEMVSALVYGQSFVVEADYLAEIAGPFEVQVVADPFFENPDPIHTNNSKSAELGVTGIVEFCGTFEKDTVWAYATYVVGCETTIPEGINLLVRSGAVIKPTLQQIVINVYGELEMRGTETIPVVITSINDEEYGADANGEQTIPPNPAEWNKIFVGSTGVVETSHALMRYGISPFYSDQGHLKVSDSVLEYFGGTTQINNGYIDLQNNVIRSHNSYGLLYSNNGPFVAAPTMINNHFEGCTNFAAMFSTYGEITMDLSQVHSNTATNNAFNGIRLTGTLAGNSFLSDAGIPYILEEDDDQLGSIFVPAGSSLTIEAGAIFKMTGSSYWYGKGTGLEIAGTLSAIGTIDDPIVFTSIHDDSVGGDTNNNDAASLPAKGDWTRNVVQPGGIATFDYVTISYAGGDVYGQTRESLRNNGGTLHFYNGLIDMGAATGIRSVNNGLVDVTNSTIRFQEEYGLYYSASGSVAPIIEDNIFDSNTSLAVYFSPSGDITLDGTQMSRNSAIGNGTNALRLIGTLSGESTLQNPGFAIYLDYNPDHILSLYIPTGSTLTIQPDTIFKGYGTSYDYGRGSGIEVYGTLNALGTAESPIVFTSLHDDTFGGDTNNNGSNTVPATGQWTNNYIGTGGTATIEYTLMRYAGGSIYGVPQATLRNFGGTLHLSNSTIEFGSGNGVRSESNGVISIHDNLIKSNTDNGIFYSASGIVVPIIQDNTFDSNTNFAIYFSPSGDLTLDGMQMSGNVAENNGTNALRLIGTLSGDSSLKDPGFAFYLDYNPDHVLSIFVPAASTLTIQRGTIFKGYGTSYWEGRGSGIEVNGILNALGIAESPIVFTSLHDDTYGGDTNNNGSGTVPATGQWTTNYIGTGGTATFEYTLMRYAGGSIHGVPQATLRNVDGTLHLSNCTIEFGSGNGVRSESNGVIDIHDNLIKSNTDNGIFYSAGGSVAPIIKDNNFDSNTNYAIYFSPSGEINLDGTQMSGNSAIGNGTNGLRLIGTLNGESTLQNPGFAFLLDYNPDHARSLYIPSGSILTIQPGTVLKGYGNSYWESKGSGIEVYGTLNAIATPGNSIVFTCFQDDTYGGDTNNDGNATAPSPGNWTGNYIGVGGIAYYNRVLMRYAGGSVYGASVQTIQNVNGSLHMDSTTIEFGNGSGIRSESNGVIDIQNSLFDSNAEHGIFYSATGVLTPIIKNNTFTTNTSFAVYFSPSGEVTLDGTQMSGNTANGNGTNALRLIANLTGSSTLQNPGFAILLDYNPDHMLSLFVTAESTLTILPGTIIKGYGSSYWESRGSGIQVSGTFSAVGTVDNPIVFTSLHDDTYAGDTNNNGANTLPSPGQWTFHYVGADGVAIFEHTLLRYAGGSIYNTPQATIFNEGGTISLTSSVIQYSANYGVLQNNGDLSVLASQVSENAIGLSVASGSTASIVDSDFLANQVGIDYSGTVPVVTENCIFEGNTSYGFRNNTALTIAVINNWWANASGPSPYGTGDAVSGNLTVSPWLTSRPR